MKKSILSQSFPISAKVIGCILFMLLFFWTILWYLRVVSCTPDIVKSVEENKADDANKSDNNKGDKMTTGIGLTPKSN